MNACAGDAIDPEIAELMKIAESAESAGVFGERVYDQGVAERPHGKGLSLNAARSRAFMAVAARVRAHDAAEVARLREALRDARRVIEASVMGHANASGALQEAGMPDAAMCAQSDTDRAHAAMERVDDVLANPSAAVARIETVIDAARRLEQVLFEATPPVTEDARWAPRRQAFRDALLDLDGVW